MRFGLFAASLALATASPLLEERANGFCKSAKASVRCSPSILTDMN